MVTEPLLLLRMIRLKGILVQAVRAVHICMFHRYLRTRVAASLNNQFTCCLELQDPSERVSRICMSVGFGFRDGGGGWAEAIRLKRAR